MVEYTVNWGGNEISSIDYIINRYFVDCEFVPNYDPDNGDVVFLYKSSLIKENDNSDKRYRCYLESTSLFELKDVIIDIDEVGW
jgi:hypothetical protein